MRLRSSPVTRTPGAFLLFCIVTTAPAGCDEATDVANASGDEAGMPPTDMSTFQPSDFGGESTRDGGADAAPGTFGAACDDAEDCASGWCIELDGARGCTEVCGQPSDCPDGYTCSAVRNAGADVTLICVPALNLLCQACETDADCQRNSTLDRCLTIGRGTFCGGDCSQLDCPAGYACSDVPSEDPAASTRQCLPVSGQCAGCVDPDGDGYGEGGDCLGIDCDEVDTTVNAGGTETCDGRDNDCDFMVDEEVALPPGTCLSVGECVQAAPLCLGGRWDCRYPGSYEAPEESRCDLLDNDCDGQVDEVFDFQTDTRNCGRCGNQCLYDNAEGRCDTGLCTLGACLPGWIDLNDNDADGCEHECIFQSADDLPDTANVDANCDGVDGDLTRAVFVDTLSGGRRGGRFPGAPPSDPGGGHRVGGGSGQSGVRLARNLRRTPSSAGRRQRVRGLRRRPRLATGRWRRDVGPRRNDGRTRRAHLQSDGPAARPRRSLRCRRLG
jgi:hypothetical protein